MKIKVGVSNRHVHLTKEDYVALFCSDVIEVRNPLNQPGEFASNSTVTIKSESGRILENVRILGPFREYSQVEVSKTDAIYLKLNPPVRKSGDVGGSAPITIIGPKGELNLKEGLIIANRHLHLDNDMARELGLVDNQVINVNINTEKKGSIEVIAKVTKEAYFEIHLDTDDANGFLIENGNEVEAEL